jgi:hypothetical protein
MNATQEQRNIAVQRVQHPEIRPLELSEVLVDGATLWECSQRPGFSIALRKALDALHEGPGTTRWRDPLPAVLSGFEAVYLTGGRVEEEALRRELSQCTSPVLFGEKSVFSAADGGFEVLRAHGLSGWVADLGKSQLKLVTPGRQWTFPRDWTRLRVAGDVSPDHEPAQRRRLREFIALKLQFAIAQCGHRPQAMVFALPVKLDDDGTPHGSNYAGMRGDHTLLPDALEMAGLAGLPLFVLNDAELAALSALADARLAGFRKVLVLTLGFGIGAALIDRGDASSSVKTQK